MPVTLEKLLAARDARREHQECLLSEYPGLTLLVLTINIPGNEKRTPASRGIGSAGVEAIRSVFGADIRYEEIRDLETGFEAYFLLDRDREAAKLLTVDIEETHPLGRIMDIDIIGEGCVPLSRTAYGLTGRRCMLCGENARICMREGRHSVEELLDFINKKWDGYLQRT